jgi:hypothetical protein
MEMIIWVNAAKADSTYLPIIRELFPDASLRSSRVLDYEGVRETYSAVIWIGTPDNWMVDKAKRLFPNAEQITFEVPA